MYYRSQVKFGTKVMFLHLSVNYFVHGEMGCYDVTSCYGQHPLDNTVPFDSTTTPWTAPSTQTAPPLWTAPPPDSIPPRQHHPQASTPSLTGKKAGGTHPTGMLSCLNLKSHRNAGF